MSKIKLTGNASGTGTLTIAAPNTNSDYTISLPEVTGGDFVVTDSSGNVGIGTSSPASTLQVGSESSSNTLITVESANNTTAGIDLMGDLSGTKGFRVKYEGNGNYFAIEDNTSSVLTERMRIDSSGNLLVGTTSTSFSVDGLRLYNYGAYEAVRTNAPPLQLNLRGTNGVIANFHKDNTVVGTVSVTGSSTSYNTSSDYRLKTDVQPMTGATERLKALKPGNFEWISSGERVDGFLAHEAQEVVPEAVTGTKDAMRTEEYEVTPAVLDDDGNVVTEAVMGTREVPDYQGIDQSKLVPLLTSALQEAIARIETLEAEVAALKGA